MTITTNTLLDFQQQALYPETLIERLFYDSNLAVSGNRAISRAIIMDSSSAPVTSSSCKGPLIFDLSTMQGYMADNSMSGTGGATFFNRDNKYTALDLSVFTYDVSNSILSLKYDTTQFDVSGSTGFSIIQSYDDSLFSAIKTPQTPVADTSTYIRIKHYDSSNVVRTDYMSKEDLCQIMLSGPAASTAYYLVGTTKQSGSGINDLTVAQSGSTNYVYWKDYNMYQTSDINLKKPVGGLDFELSDLKAIDKFKFVWRHEPKENVQIGVSAQSVEKLFPEVVTEVNGVKGVAYDKLSVIALAAIDKLTDKISMLEKRISELELRLANVEGNQPVVLGGGETELY